MPNPIKRHALAASPTLPFRSGKSLECKSCYNAIGIQAGGDQGYRAKLAKECGTQKDNDPGGPAGVDPCGVNADDVKEPP